jgi:phasin
MNDDRTAKAAREAMDKTTAAGAETARGVQEGLTSAVENVRDLNVRLIDMARANTEAAFDFAHEVATAKAPSDLAQVWSTHTRKQFEMLTKQASELTALYQRFASTTAEPLRAAWQ